RSCARPRAPGASPTRAAQVRPGCCLHPLHPRLCGHLALPGCGTPPTLLFAELNKEHKNQTEFPTGTTVKYSCGPGYAKHPQIPPTITCLENQTWSDPQEFCKRKSCRYCHLLQWQCGHQSLWLGRCFSLSVPPSSCFVPGKRCEHPGEPENGRVIVTTDVMFGSTVNYTCEEGFRLVGPAQRRCVISEAGKSVVWSGDVPACQRKYPPPPDIPRGTHSGRHTDNFSFAAVVTYTCEPGHALTGEASIFCTTEDGLHGVWSAPPPRERAGEQVPEQVPVPPSDTHSITSSSFPLLFQGCSACPHQTLLVGSTAAIPRTPLPWEHSCTTAASLASSLLGMSLSVVRHTEPGAVLYLAAKVCPCSY
uniref:Sushi domain-containing protein n=1 Tax=Nothoprocta perdicaria TaxID=30464 RepID=A0A8C6ZBN0_NOTPE